MHQKMWLIFAPLGLALIGFGVSVTGYAVELRTLGGGLLDMVLVGNCGARYSEQRRRVFRRSGQTPGTLRVGENSE